MLIYLLHSIEAVQGVQAQGRRGRAQGLERARGGGHAAHADQALP